MDKNYNILMKYLKYVRTKTISNVYDFKSELINLFKKTRTIVHVKDRDFEIEMYFTIYSEFIREQIISNQLNYPNDYYNLKREENFVINFHLSNDKITLINPYYFGRNNGNMGINQKSNLIKSFDFQDLMFLNMVAKMKDDKTIIDYIKILLKSNRTIF